MHLSVSHPLSPKTQTLRTAAVCDQFGLELNEDDRLIVATNLDLPAEPGQIIAFIGESGSGKSSLLRALSSRLRGRGDLVIDLNEVDLGDRPLIDLLPGPVDAALALLARCGLGEPRLALRTPAELSEGQRHRFRLALAFSRASQPWPIGRGRTAPVPEERCPSESPAPQSWLLADEFTATLDRTLAKVLAFNVRRLAAPSLGLLIATTHEDIFQDLAPNVHVRCRLDEEPAVIPSSGAETCSTKKPDVSEDIGFLAAGHSADRTRSNSSPVSPPPKGRPPTEADASGSLPTFDPLPSPLFTSPPSHRISFANELFLTEGTRLDWPHFARWHYRSHHIGVARFITLLVRSEERAECELLQAASGSTPGVLSGPAADRLSPTASARPIGICVFVAPPMSLAGRNAFFGRPGPWSRLGTQALNAQLLMLQRVVLHPTYRGAGLASRFVRHSCERAAERLGVSWVETLSNLAASHPVFERAGFTRVGRVAKEKRRSKRTTKSRSRTSQSALYGGERPVTEETFRKSRHSRPTYLIFDARPASIPQQPKEKFPAHRNHAG